MSQPTNPPPRSSSSAPSLLFSIIHPVRLVLLCAAASTMMVPFNLMTTIMQPMVIHLGIPNWALPLMSVVMLFLAVLYPVFGNMSDKCTSSLGRRRPFIIFGFALVSVAMILYGILEVLDFPDNPATVVLLMLGAAPLMVGQFAVSATANPLIFDFVPELYKVQVGLFSMFETNFVALICLGIISIDKFVFFITLVVYIATNLATVLTVKETPLNELHLQNEQQAGINDSSASDNTNEADPHDESRPLLSTPSAEDVKEQYDGEPKEATSAPPPPDEDIFILPPDMPDKMKIFAAIKWLFTHRVTLVLEILLMLNGLGGGYFNAYYSVLISQGVYHTEEPPEDTKDHRLEVARRAAAFLKMAQIMITMIFVPLAHILLRKLGPRKTLFMTHFLVVLMLILMFLLKPLNPDKLWGVFFLGIFIAVNDALNQSIPNVVLAQHSSADTLALFLGAHGMMNMLYNLLASVVPLILVAAIPTWSAGYFYMQWVFLVNAVFMVIACGTVFFFPALKMR